MTTWLLMLSMLGGGMFAATEALAHLRPDLTGRQRWGVVLWTFFAFASFYTFWRVGTQ